MEDKILPFNENASVAQWQKSKVKQALDRLVEIDALIERLNDEKFMLQDYIRMKENIIE